MNSSKQHVRTALIGLTSFIIVAVSPAQDAKDAVNAQARLDSQAMAEARKKRDAIVSQRHDMRDPKVRAEVVRQLEETDKELQAALLRQANVRGLETEGAKPNGGRFRLIDIDSDGSPIYEETHNVDAAITTAADVVQVNPTYNSVDGAGITIGVWEAGGIPRVTHQEYAGRVTILDGSTSTSDHASHVTGTLISQGINPDTLGMAPAASVSAFTSGNATAEMMANGAAAPNSSMLYLSNHSYGVGQGWYWSSTAGWSFRGTYSDDGNSANDYEADFGRYASRSVQWDGIAYNLPYYLIFASSGNQRTDQPANGNSWTHGGNTYTYDPAIHPDGDGDYKNGYDNMEGGTLGKNVIAVGNADEGIDGSGNRDPGQATAQTSSSRGPTDDGRIKPDIYGNGTGLRSCTDNSNTSTASYSGTSMSSPNVCGSAALLIHYYTSRFPGQAMRASTLKALILHTADDRGKTGPDYKYGWGIMNTEAAADVIKLHADNGGGARILEDVVNDTTTLSQTHSFAWDGSSPLRVTLCWTDPQGTQITSHDNRTKVLVNDLNLTVSGPGGATHLPYVMPYVGDWTLATIEDKAVTGINDVDNVEQVYLSAPAAGQYTVTIDYAGSLTNNLQDYSLIVTGQTAPEIDVSYTGLPAATLTDNTGVEDFGAIGLSQAPIVRTYTITNTGGNPLTGLAISQSGSHPGDFTVSALATTQLESGQSTSFTVTFDPLALGTRTAAIHLTSNDADEAPFDIPLTGVGLTELEVWRVQYFGNFPNVGNGANILDFDNDGTPNLVEFALGMDPTQAEPCPLQPILNGTQMEFDFTRSVIAMTEFTIEVIWAPDLNPSTVWSTAGLTEVILTDDGVIQEVQTSMPIGTASKRFFRIRVIP